MAFTDMAHATISICVDCVYFNAYGRLDDQTMEANPNAAIEHANVIEGQGWGDEAEFTPGCGRDCPEHGQAAVPEDWDEDGDCLREEDPEPWFSSSQCEQCGTTLGGEREHATVWYYAVT